MTHPTNNPNTILIIKRNFIWIIKNNLVPILLFQVKISNGNCSFFIWNYSFRIV